MAAAPEVGSFPSPHEVETPAGCEGWEEMYPYYARFDEERRDADEHRFWFWNSMHFPVPMPAFDAICIDTAYQALGTWQNRVFAVPPAMGIDWRCINGYIYISGNPVTDPAKIAERAGFFQQRAGYYYANWDDLYAKWRTKMDALIEELEALRGAAAPRVRAGRGRLRRPGDELLRRPRRVPNGAPARRPDVAEPLRVPAPRLRRVHDLRRALQGQPAGHPRSAHRADGRRARRSALQARRRAAAPRAPRHRHGRRRGIRRGSLAVGDRRCAGRERRRPRVARGARERQGPVVPHGDRRRPLPHVRLVVRRSDDPVCLADRIRRRAQGGRGDRAPDRITSPSSASASQPSTPSSSTTTRARGSRSCSRSRGRSSRTSRSTSSSATTGS